MKIIKQTLKTIFNIICFFAFSAILLYIWWSLSGKTYLFSTQPVGGDYFNALTYVNFFYHYSPLPPLGWIPFWNEGSPVIGGYPWLAFYLMKPLMIFFDPAYTMEIASSIALALFFLASLLLFRKVCKNWLVAFTLTLILVVTKATYYPLITGGFVISATTQWYLPAVLLFTYLYFEKQNKHFLALAAIFTGISLIHHAPTSIITILLPTLVILMLYQKTHRTLKTKLFDAVIFLLTASAIGSLGLYTFLEQMFSGSGKTLCASPECWGVYPRHLTTWMNPLPLILILFFSSIIIISKLFKRQIRTANALSAAGGLFILILYALAAYLHLIDGPTNVFFPTRLFWAANLFLLLISAHLFQGIRVRWKKLSFIFAAIAAFIIVTAIYISPPSIHGDYVNTVPVYIAQYTIPKYKTHSLNEFIPSWLPLKEKNWRLDTFDSGLTQWWNYASAMPNTRGYAIGTNQTWQYFLQVSTRDPKNENHELTKNRALFLLDAFGIKYRENSIASYPQSILTDSKIVTRQDTLKNFTWYQFSSDYVSPIISPTNSNALLFIGDDIGFENFIRTISMTNLNSFSLIPVKGPTDIGEVSEEELKKFKAVVCYQFTGNDWSKITSFAKKGGLVFVETGSLKNHPVEKLPEIFPVNSLTQIETRISFNKAVNNSSEIVSNIGVEKFSPLVYEGGPWRLSTTKPSDLKPWAKPAIQHNNNLLIAQGELEKGQVVWSGMNLIYHTVKYDNYEEAKLFANILSPIAVKRILKPTFTVQRDNPRIIKIDAKNINGIYFKENYHPGWQAESNGKKLKIYKAGLDFMYIPVPQLINNQSQQIVLSFNGSIITWLLFSVSIIAFLLTVLYLIIPHPFHALHRLTHYHVKDKVVSKVNIWWQKEEE